MFPTLMCVLLVSQAAVTTGQNPPKKQEPPKTKVSTSVPAPARQRVATNIRAFELAPPVKPAAVAGVIGASRGVGGNAAAVALAPRLARVYSRPRFYWRAAAAVRQVSVLVTDEDGNEVFHDVASGTEYQYPADAPAFKPGSIYYWSVQADPPSGATTPSEVVGFVVVTGEEREEMEASLRKLDGLADSEAALARARAYRDAGLWYETVAGFTDLIRARPSDARLYRERAEVFAQIPATIDQATADQQKADALTATNGKTR
ncbi:MAG: DUF928 domain-containing protein [Terriglobales bacterium]